MNPVYRVRILDDATSELSRLDKPVARRIAMRVDWLSRNLDNIKPEVLTGDLAGLFKLRVGDYRVLYEVFRSEREIVIHLVGHRREIYRRK